MGWGVTRQKVYNLLLSITCQTFEGKDSCNEKPVSKVYRLEAATGLKNHISKRRAMSLNG